MSRIALLTLIVVAACSSNFDALRAGEENTDAAVKERMRAEADRARQDAFDRMQQSQQAMKERIKLKAAEIDAQIQDLRKAGNEDKAASLEQTRAALMRSLAEADAQPFVPQLEDIQRVLADKKQPPNPPQSRLRVKLPNGAELEAEGQWLQTMPDTTREILEQFSDPAKDGAITFRVPDQLDVDAVVQLHNMLVKVAPKVELEYSEKLRLLTAVSEDPAQLRRVAGVFRSLKSNFDNPKKMQFKDAIDPNMKFPGQPEDMKKIGPGVPPGGKGKGEMDVKKQ